MVNTGFFSKNSGEHPVQQVESDFDGDGDPDATDPDDDNDNLSDVEEAAYGTDPLKADTDGVGINDGDEVNAGRNPLVNEAAVLMIINSILLED